MVERNKLSICTVFFFLLMFERQIHFCITLKTTYGNYLLMKILSKMLLSFHCFQGSESFVL